MKRKFKVTFLLNGVERDTEIEAYSKYDAKKRFYLTTSADNIIRIEEVKE